MDDIPTKESIQANLIELWALLTRLTSIGVLPANPEWIDNIGSECQGMSQLRFHSD